MSQKVEIKFVYLVIGKTGISCCDSLEIAMSFLKSIKPIDKKAVIVKHVLFTKDVF